MLTCTNWWGRRVQITFVTAVHIRDQIVPTLAQWWATPVSLTRHYASGGPKAIQHRYSCNTRCHWRSRRIVICHRCRSYPRKQPIMPPSRLILLFSNCFRLVTQIILTRFWPSKEPIGLCATEKSDKVRKMEHWWCDLTLSARGSILDFIIYRRQILTSKVDPGTGRVKHF